MKECVNSSINFQNDIAKEAENTFPEGMQKPSMETATVPAREQESKGGAGRGSKGGVIDVK